MITRNLFIKSMEAIKKQMDYDVKFSHNMGKAFPNAFEANLLPNNEFLLSQMISLLEELTGDNSDLISYYIWELNFGTDDSAKDYFDDVSFGGLYDVLSATEI